MTCSQNQTEVLWVPTHTHTNYTNYTNWLNIRSWIQLCTALVHPNFHTNIKAYCNITADSGNHYFTDDLLKTHTHTHTHPYNYCKHYLAYCGASRHVVSAAQRYFLVSGYFMEAHRGDAAECLLPCVSPRGVEEGRNGREAEEEEEERGNR